MKQDFSPFSFSLNYQVLSTLLYYLFRKKTTFNHIRKTNNEKKIRDKKVFTQQKFIAILIIIINN